MLSPEYERGLAIGRGRIPDGVEPDSPEGRQYARLIAHIRADVAKAPPVSDETKRRVLVLLRGGRHDR